jgi:glycosyltransferase involved in cell wall biosynthesis
MRILLTNHELARRTGTELLTAELAGALRTRGHETAVFTWCRGELAARLEASGVAVVDDPRRVPFTPDVIHGQHHLTTMAALAAWPGVPGLFFCHGVLPFDEQPPRHPRLRLYLSMAAINAEWLATAAGATPDRVSTLPNWFDPARFAAVRDSGAPATRAALFSNRIGPGPVFDVVRAACAKHGLELAGLGRGFGAVTDSPETELPAHTVVFATGRSALEALASGCAVIPLDPVAGLGTLVTPEDFEVHRDRNWCVYQRPTEVTAEAVEAQLARLAPAAAAEVTRRVRSELTLEQAATALESHYRRVVTEFSGNRGTDEPVAAPEETGALIDYLRFLAARTREADDAFLEARREARLAARVPQLRDEAAAARRDLRGMIRRLQGSWWGRRFLRRHGGWQNQPPE